MIENKRESDNIGCGPALKAHIFLLTALLIVLFIFSTSMGYLHISAQEVVKILFSRIFSLPTLCQGIDKVKPFVIIDVRLPRILSAAFVGAGLSVAGVIFQGLLLNPLADPYTLGISAGAAFGAALALVFNLQSAGFYSLPLFAFAGALLSLFSVIYLATSEEYFSSGNLILSGIIISTILSAGISFLKYLANERVAIIIFWLMGSFASKTWPEVILVGSLFIIGYGICLFFARDLNIISLGERSAHTLGVNIKQVRLILLITASLITAVCVSISGIIGFVGLIIPHLMRFFVGADNQKLLPVCALAGAILLLSADTVTRALLPTEVPIGILTALIGGPFFCYIFKKRHVGSQDG